MSISDWFNLSWVRIVYCSILSCSAVINSIPLIRPTCRLDFYQTCNNNSSDWTFLVAPVMSCTSRAPLFDDSPSEPSQVICNSMQADFFVLIPISGTIITANWFLTSCYRSDHVIQGLFQESKQLHTLLMIAPDCTSEIFYIIYDAIGLWIGWPKDQSIFGHVYAFGHQQ